MKHVIVIYLVSPQRGELAFLQVLLALNECRVTPEVLVFAGKHREKGNVVWLIVDDLRDSTRLIDRLGELVDVKAVEVSPCEDIGVELAPPMRRQSEREKTGS